jgi:hypothetical protein
MPGRAHFVERGGDGRGDVAARLVGNQGDALIRPNREADLDGVARAGFEVGRADVGVARPTASRYDRSSTAKAATCPPPEVTLARPVALRRVRKPASLPRKT